MPTSAEAGAALGAAEMGMGAVCGGNCIWGGGGVTVVAGFPPCGKGAPTAISQRWPGCPWGGLTPLADVATGEGAGFKTIGGVAGGVGTTLTAACVSFKAPFATGETEASEDIFTGLSS